jgi:hypothetical protein
MAEIAVSRQMFADILRLIARPRAPARESMRLWGQMRQGPLERCALMRAEQRVPRLGAGQNAASTPPAPAGRDLPLRGRPDEDPGLTTTWNRGNVGLTA